MPIFKWHSLVFSPSGFESSNLRFRLSDLRFGLSNLRFLQRNMAFLAPTAGEGEERPQGFDHYVREEEVEKQVHGDFYGH